MHRSAAAAIIGAPHKHYVKVTQPIHICFLECDSQCGSFCIGPSSSDCVTCPTPESYRLLYASTLRSQGKFILVITFLGSWTCAQTCPSAMIKCSSYSQQLMPPQVLNYCREPTYFVDPSSNLSNIELGTQNFPFKALDDPFRELFNNADGQFRNVTIFLKHGSNLTVHSIDMPLLALNINLTLIPYYADNQTDFSNAAIQALFRNANFTKVQVFHKQYWRRQSYFNPTIYSSRNDSSPYAYDYQLKAFSQNLFPQSAVSTTKLKFVTYNSNILAQLIHFDEITFADSSTNSLFVPNQSPQRWIQLDSCYFTLKQMHFFVQDGGNLKLSNSLVDISLQSRIVQYSASTDCSVFLIPGSANNLVFDNNTFIGQSQSGYTALIYGQNHLNFTFTNNKFLDFTWVSSGVSIIIQNFQLGCAFKPFTKLLITTNLIANSVVKRFSNIYFSLNLDKYGSQEVAFENNTFKNIQYGNQDILNIQRAVSTVDDFKLSVKNIIFKSVSNTVSASNLISTQTQKLTIQNISIIESEVSSGILVSASNSSLREITINNVSSAGLHPDQTLLKISNSDFMEIDSVSFTNIKFNSLSAFNLYFNNNQAITNLSILNSTFESSQTLISLFDVKNVSFFGINISKLVEQNNAANLLQDGNQSTNANSVQPSQANIFGFQLLKPWLDSFQNNITITNLSLSNSSISFLNVISVANDVEMVASEISLSLNQLFISENNLSGKSNFISTQSFSYQRFKMLIKDLIVTNNQLELGSFCQFQHNSKENHLKNIQFTANLGILLSLVPFNTLNIDKKLQANISDSRFQNNTGKESSIFLISKNSNLRVLNSTFKGLYSTGRGSVAFVEGFNAQAQFSSSTFESNCAYQGGLFFTQLEGQVLVFNSVIRDNFAFTGGVLYSQNEGTAIFFNVSLSNNLAFQNSLVFAINSRSQIQMGNIIITQNGKIYNQVQIQNFNMFLTDLNYQVKQQDLMQKNYYSDLNKKFSSAYLLFVIQNFQEARYLISLEDTDHQIRLIMASIFIGNSTSVFDQDFLLGADSQSTITIKDTQFSNIMLTTNSHFSFVQSSVVISDIQISNFSTEEPLISLQESSLSINSSQVYNFKGSLLAAQGSQIHLEDLNFSKLTQVYQTSEFIRVSKSKISGRNIQFNHIFQLNTVIDLIFASQSQLMFSFLKIHYFETRALNLFKSSLTLSNSQFESAILLGYCAGINLAQSNSSIANTTFRNLSSAKGSAIYAFKKLNDINQYSLEIINSVFYENIAEEAGAIYLQNYNTIIRSSFFNQNIASLVRAGAIYHSCTETINQKCSLSLINNSFANNSGPLEGGSIYYDLFQPTHLSINTFNNNSAIYGPNLASYPCALLMIDEFNQPINSSNSTEVSLSTMDILYFVQQSNLTFASGQEMQTPIRIGIFDQNFQLIVKDNSSIGQINTNDQGLSISVNSKVQAVQGIFHFEKVTFTYQPGLSTNIFIESENLETQKYEIITKKPFKNLNIPIAFRMCHQGEVKFQGKCQTCQKSTYSFDPLWPKCLPCFSNAQCMGGNQTLVDSGYWRTSNISSLVHSCLNHDACLQDFQMCYIYLSRGGLNSECKEGYLGKLCNSCVWKINGQFFTKSGYECVQCESVSMQLFKLFGIVVLFCLYVAFILLQIIFYLSSQFSSLLYSPRRNKPQTVLLRILTNYFQAIMITKDFELFWPDSIKKMLDALSFLSSQNQKAFSLDCLNKQIIGIQINPFYFKILCFALLPIALSILAIAAWTLAYGIMRIRTPIHKKVRLNLWKNIEVTIYLIIFICYPIITNISFSLFSCDKIEDLGYFLKSDYEIQCWVGTHRLMIFILGIPIIFIWILGFPVYIWIRINFNREKLDLKEFISRLGLFYIGYTNECFYWEILVVNLRKILFILCSTLLTFLSPQFKACCGITILLIQVQLMRRMEPYIDPEFLRVDYHSTYSAIATLYGGLFLMVPSFSDNSQLLSLLFVAILFYNLYFYILWTYRFIEVLLRQHAQQLRRYICCYFLRRVQIDTYDQVVKKHQRKHLLLKSYKRNSIIQRVQMLNSFKGELTVSLEGIEIQHGNSTLPQLKGDTQFLPKMKAMRSNDGQFFDNSLTNSNSSIMTEQNMEQEINSQRRLIYQDNNEEEFTNTGVLHRQRQTNRQNFSIKDFQVDKQRIIQKNIAKKLRGTLNHSQLNQQNRSSPSLRNKQQNLYKNNDFEKSQAIQDYFSQKELKRLGSQQNIKLKPKSGNLKGLQIDQEFCQINSNCKVNDNLLRPFQIQSQSVVSTQNQEQQGSRSNIQNQDSYQRLEIIKQKYANYKKFDIDNELDKLDNKRQGTPNKRQEVKMIEKNLPLSNISALEKQNNAKEIIIQEKDSVPQCLELLAYKNKEIQVQNFNNNDLLLQTLMLSQQQSVHLPILQSESLQSDYKNNLSYEEVKETTKSRESQLQFLPRSRPSSTVSEISNQSSNIYNILGINDNLSKSQIKKQQFEDKFMSDMLSQQLEGKSISSQLSSDKMENNSIEIQKPSLFPMKSKFFFQVEQLGPSQSSFSNKEESQEDNKDKQPPLVSAREINRSIQGSARLRRNSTALGAKEQARLKKTEKRLQELREFDGNLKINIDYLLGAKRMAKKLSTSRSIQSIKDDDISSTNNKDSNELSQAESQFQVEQKPILSSTSFKQELGIITKPTLKRSSANIIPPPLTQKQVSFSFGKAQPKPRYSSRGISHLSKQEIQEEHLRSSIQQIGFRPQDLAIDSAKNNKTKVEQVIERQFSSMLFDIINKNNITNSKDQRRKKKRSNSQLDDDPLQLLQSGKIKKPKIQRSRKLNLSSMKINNL